MSDYTAPSTFNAAAYANRWFSWQAIEDCFWPGRGVRSESIDASLAGVKDIGGIYVMASSDKQPTLISPKCPEVQYVGQTRFFKGRMGQFATSAGFWGGRANGHSAGWRWPEGQKDRLHIAFFPVGNDWPAHLAEGLRHWMEALAIEAYRQTHSTLPPLNLTTSSYTSQD